MPPIQPLKRRNLVADDSEQPGTSAQAAEGFRLQSGRVIRKINAAPPTGIRSWKPPQLPKPEECETTDLPLTGTRLVAEAMYIVKPVVHLSSMYVFGPRDWKPWCISLAMDLTSLQLLRHKRGPPVLSRRQRLELSRRSLSLLLYLLRSPFYEAHSRDRVSALLRALSSSLPLVRWVLNPLAEYIPHWQDTYFYVWST